MSLIALPSTTTQAGQVFDHLRGEILSCRIAPGAKIRINEIAARLDVSLGSVREALSRLSAEGMVIAQAQKGYSIAPVSEEEFVDLTNTRISIEQLCLRNAMEHGDVEWETGIVAAFHRLHRIPERDQHKALMEAVLGRNADLACGLISDHLWRTTRILLASPILAGVDGDDS